MLLKSRFKAARPLLSNPRASACQQQQQQQKRLSLSVSVFRCPCTVTRGGGSPRQIGEHGGWQLSPQASAPPSLLLEVGSNAPPSSYIEVVEVQLVLGLVPFRTRRARRVKPVEAPRLDVHRKLAPPTSPPLAALVLARHSASSSSSASRILCGGRGARTQSSSSQRGQGAQQQKRPGLSVACSTTLRSKHC